MIFSDVVSSSIIADSGIGKWKLIQNALHPLIPLLQGKVICADRELSNEEMQNFFHRHQIGYSIRLKVGAGRSEITITDKKRRKIDISIDSGSKKSWKEVFYKGKIKVNIAAEWISHMSEPMYIITDCEPHKGLKHYKKRMKIEESFKDTKDKLGFTKAMNKKLDNLLKLLLIGFLAYNLLILIGEQLREKVLTDREKLKFSGLHLLFNMVYRFTRSRLRKVMRYVELQLLEINSDDYVWLRAFRSC